MALARAAEERLGSAVSSEAGRDKGGVQGGGGESRLRCVADSSCSCCFIASPCDSIFSIVVFGVGGWPGGRSGSEAKSLMPGETRAKGGIRRVTSLCPLETTRSLPGYCGGNIFGTGEDFLIFCVILQVLI